MPAAAPATVPAVVGGKPQYYKRDLPPACIPFTSPEGKALFGEALADGTMECYFPLAAQFRTQEEPAYCGLTTLVMTLNALNIDPRRLWKGVWRWFSEEMLDCCKPMAEIRERGIDLGTFMCLANCNSAAATLVRPPPAGDDVGALSAFRAAMEAAARRSEGEFMVLSYSRPALGQTGEGHFSPMGGYHRGRDMVLVMDVARFKYMPHWVPVPAMWKAMQALDASTRLPRGYVLLRRRAAAPLLLFNVADGAADAGTRVAGAGAGCMTRRLRHTLESSLAAARAAVLAARVPHGDVAAAVRLFVAAFNRTADGADAAPRCIDKLSREHLEVAAALVLELERTALYPIVAAAVAAASARRGVAHGSGTSGDSDCDSGAVAVLTAVDESSSSSGGGGREVAKAPGCGSCGVSCIRVHPAHVMTLLLLSFAIPPAAPQSAAGAAPLCNHGHGGAHGHEHFHSGASLAVAPRAATVAAAVAPVLSLTAAAGAADLLCGAASNTWRGASELLKQEIVLLTNQLLQSGSMLHPAAAAPADAPASAAAHSTASSLLLAPAPASSGGCSRCSSSACEVPTPAR